MMVRGLPPRFTGGDGFKTDAVTRAVDFVLSGGGFNREAPSAGGVLSPTWSMDFSAPPTQVLHTAAQVATISGVSPTHVYTTSGTGDVVDQVGALDLTEFGTPLRNQKAVGLWGGTSFADYQTAELQNGNHGFASAAQTELSLDKDFAVAWLFRASWRSSSNQNIISAKDGINEGWHVRATATSITFEVENSAFSTFAVQTFKGGAQYGTWQMGFIKWIASTQTAYVGCTDRPSLTSTTATGSFTTDLSTQFKIGRSSYDAMPMQMPWLCIWTTGSSALAWADVAGLFTVGSFDSRLTTNKRSGHLGNVVAMNGASELCAKFYGENNDDTDQLSYGMVADSSTLGAWTQRATTNLCTHSERFDTGGVGWNAVGPPTVTSKAINGPDGCRNADTVTKAGANDRIIFGFTASGATEHSFSVKLCGNGWSGDAVIGFYNTGDTTALATTTCAVVDGEWKTYEVRYTTAAFTAYKLSIEPSARGVAAAGQSIGVQWALLTTGASNARGFVPTDGATATTTTPNYQMTPDSFTANAGSLRVRFAWPIDDRSATHYLIRRSTTTANALFAYISSSETLTIELYSAAGVLLAQASYSLASLDLTDETEFWIRWDAANGVADALTPGHALDIVVGGASVASNGTAPLAGITETTLPIIIGASSTAGANGHDAPLKSVDWYDSVPTLAEIASAA